VGPSPSASPGMYLSRFHRVSLSVISNQMLNDIFAYRDPVFVEDRSTYSLMRYGISRFGLIMFHVSSVEYVIVTYSD
jgi:hypothetical protein